MLTISVSRIGEVPGAIPIQKSSGRFGALRLRSLPSSSLSESEVKSVEKPELEIGTSGLMSEAGNGTALRVITRARLDLPLRGAGAVLLLLLRT